MNILRNALFTSLLSISALISSTACNAASQDDIFGVAELVYDDKVFFDQTRDVAMDYENNRCSRATIAKVTVDGIQYGIQSTTYAEAADEGQCFALLESDGSWLELYISFSTDGDAPVTYGFSDANLDGVFDAVDEYDSAKGTDAEVDLTKKHEVEMRALFDVSITAIAGYYREEQNRLAKQ